MKIRVEHLERETDLSAAFAIREQVFNGEDRIPKEVDFDGLDVSAEQFIAFHDNDAIGTARYRHQEDGSAKVERVAVLPQYRGKGVGKVIMEKVEETASKQGVNKLVLNSKVSSMAFYLKLGYYTIGEEFEEVGLAHIKMVKHLATP